MTDTNLGLDFSICLLSILEFGFQISSICREFQVANEKVSRTLFSRQLVFSLLICDFLIRCSSCKLVGDCGGIIVLTLYCWYLFLWIYCQQFSKHRIKYTQMLHGVFQYPKWLLLFSQTIIKEVLSPSFPWLDFKFKEDKDMHLTARGIRQNLFDIRIEMNHWHRKELWIFSCGEKVLSDLTTVISVHV